MSVAERVAAERGERVGGCVGYTIRLESKTSRDTRLLFCTTGILLKRLEVRVLVRVCACMRACVCACACMRVCLCLCACEFGSGVRRQTPTPDPRPATLNP